MGITFWNYGIEEPGADAISQGFSFKQNPELENPVRGNGDNANTQNCLFPMKLIVNNSNQVMDNLAPIIISHERNLLS